MLAFRSIFLHRNAAWLGAALGVVCGCSGDDALPAAPTGPVLPPRVALQSCFAHAAASALPMATDATPGTAPPLLSQTGCFDSLSPLTPGADLIPFDVVSELWTDGAEKQRYLVLPPGERILVSPSGTWSFPIGSVLVKHFSYDLSGQRIVETRVLAHRAEGWEAHSYEWRADGSDADLLNTWKQASFVTKSGPVTHLFPSRTSCAACHSSSADFVLGPVTAQMNHDVRWQGSRGNQIEALLWIGALELAAPEAPLDQMPDPHDSTVALEPRARAYLHANCGHCHRPGGWAPPSMDMDLRWEVPLADTGTCGVPLQSGPTFTKNRIEAGDPDASGLLDRVASQSLNRMPPMGTEQVDAQGLELLRNFVSSLEACPPKAAP